MRTAIAIAALCALGACDKLSPKPTAMAVCKQLEAKKVASKCKADKPGGIGAAAVERVVFDLPHGETGQVLRFDDDRAFHAADDAFAAASVLAGRHRYGKKSAGIFVQLNSETDDKVGAKAKAVVDGL